MIQHYLTSAWRTLTKNYFYSIINVFGLAIGLCSFVILSNYVRFENSYDQFHIDRDIIYRLESTFTEGKVVTDDWATSTYGYAQAMKNEFPEIKEYVRVNMYDSERTVKYNDIVYREENVFFADFNFFTFFSFPLLKGDATEVLTQPNTCVISEEVAHRFFPNGNAMDKMLSISTIEQHYMCKVSGIFRELPAQSNLKFNILMSYATAPNWQRTSWYMHEAYTYMKVNTVAEARSIERKFPALAEKYKTEPALKNKIWGIKLVPLSEIHLNAAKPYEREIKGNRTLVAFMLIIAILILLIAWINYVNIFTAKTMERAGEISIRKVNGSSFGGLIVQFLTESVVLNLCSLVVSIIMLFSIVHSIGYFFGEAVSNNIFTGFFTWKILSIAFFTGIILTGLSPVFILNKVKVSNAVKNSAAFRVGLGKHFREGLVVAQYVASIILIIATLTMHKQLLFMQHQDKGVLINQIMVFKTPVRSENFDAKTLALIEEIKNLPGVVNVTSSSSVPGIEVAHYASNKRADDPSNKTNLFEMLRVGYDYIPLYGIQFVVGRNFSKQYPTDVDGLVLNQNAMRLFGFRNADEALKGEVMLEGISNKKFHIVGITRDFHHLSLKQACRPIILMMIQEHQWIRQNFYSVKINTSQMAPILSRIESVYKLRFPESSFDYFFLDQFYNLQYRSDAQNEKLIGMFTWLAILIVCLGIISLTDFLLLKRTKEIGVRKVIGAKSIQIVSLINKDFVILTLIALLIAWPLAWYAMNQWLNNFAYHTELSWWIFAVAGLMSTAIALITVSWQSWRAARRNPIEALRNE